MHRPQFFTWTKHTADNTTLLDYKKLYTYMCNIVTEFYLYSIVYIYLINSRLDVTYSVRHHFRTIQTLSLTLQGIGSHSMGTCGRKMCWLKQAEIDNKTYNASFSFT